MQLITLGSNSQGNCYILQGKTQSLILEAGIPVKSIKIALNFDLSNVVGCLISHCHGDHAKYAKEIMGEGIDVCSSVGTLDTLNPAIYHHRMRVLKAQKKYIIGEFTVMPFDIEHDAPQPFGYLIKHNECGLVLFVTDTMYLKYKFPGLNNMIIECNYSQDIIDSNNSNGETIDLVRKRVMQSHMSFETVKEILTINDISKVNNIVLIHLSDRNSDAALFKSEIANLTGKNVHIGEPGLNINFDINPF